MHSGYQAHFFGLLTFRFYCKSLVSILRSVECCVFHVSILFAAFVRGLCFILADTYNLCMIRLNRSISKPCSVQSTCAFLISWRFFCEVFQSLKIQIIEVQVVSISVTVGLGIFKNYRVTILVHQKFENHYHWELNLFQSQSEATQFAAFYRAPTSPSDAMEDADWPFDRQCVRLCTIMTERLKCTCEWRVDESWFNRRNEFLWICAGAAVARGFSRTYISMCE